MSEQAENLRRAQNRERFPTIAAFLDRLKALGIKATVTLKILQFHDYAAIFPLIEDLTPLIADIKSNGLFVPIVLFDGKILDGRNRYLACLKSGIEPRFETYAGSDPIHFVVSLNRHRRHMTASQLAVAALKIEECEAVEAKKRQLAGLKKGDEVPVIALMPQRENGKSSDAAAKAMGVSPRYVQDAKRIAKEAPDLIPEIERGEKTITEAKREIVRAQKIKTIANISNNTRPLEAQLGRFPLIYCDPPWRYDHVETETRAIDNHYPTMDLESILDLPVPSVTTDDCILFMWATSPKLEEALSVLRAWGFSYRTCAVWDKEKIGMGYYFRQQHELLLIGTKGTIPVPEPHTRPSSIIRVSRGKHSAKPLLVYEIIEKMYPDFPKLELFSRSPREGWISWGNQADVA